MAKYANDLMMDAALNYIRDNAEKLCVCSAQPLNYTEAVTNYSLASAAVDSSDFTLANGDSNGRKVTVAQQSSMTIGTSGSANHVAIVATSSTALLLVTTVTEQALTAAGTVTTNAFDDEIADPS